MTNEKEQKAIERLKFFEPDYDDDGYYLAYSGGKDSDCIKILAQLAGVKFTAHHNLTTVDAPETVQYVKSQSDVLIDKAFDNKGNQITMWNLIVKKLMPPTRLARYCCSELKERTGGVRKVVVTGVRWAESVKRAESAGLVKIIGKPKSTQKLAEEIGAENRINKQGGMILDDDNDESRQMVEHCYRTRQITVNPIVDWTDEDVWEFLRHYGCKSNPLYECGFRRIGCIGCPMAGKYRYVEFERYPTFKYNYIAAFDRMLKRREELGKNANKSWETGLDVFRWWLQEDFRQITFDDLNLEEL